MARLAALDADLEEKRAKKEGLEAEVGPLCFYWPGMEWKAEHCFMSSRLVHAPGLECHLTTHTW